MNIYIDIQRLMGANGNTSAYNAEVHYEIDDQDTADLLTMDNLKDTIQEQVNLALNKRDI